MSNHAPNNPSARAVSAVVTTPMCTSMSKLTSYILSFDAPSILGIEHLRECAYATEHPAYPVFGPRVNAFPRHAVDLTLAPQCRFGHGIDVSVLATVCLGRVRTMSFTVRLVWRAIAVMATSQVAETCKSRW